RGAGRALTRVKHRPFTLPSARPRLLHQRRAEELAHEEFLEVAIVLDPRREHDDLPEPPRLPAEIARVVHADEPDHAAHDGELEVASRGRVHLDHLAPLAV